MHLFRDIFMSIDMDETSENDLTKLESVLG